MGLETACVPGAPQADAELKGGIREFKNSRIQECRVPRKLGQHFLSSESILNRIAEAVCPEHVPLVIEIGPGRGALTRKLLERADRVVAIEVDAELVEHLRATFGAALEVVHADVLTVDLAQWGHVRLFSAWPELVDKAAARLLAPSGWSAPAAGFPTGAQWIGSYLRPLAGALGGQPGRGRVRYGARVTGISRQGRDRLHSRREDAAVRRQLRRSGGPGSVRRHQQPL